VLSAKSLKDGPNQEISLFERLSFKELVKNSLVLEPNVEKLGEIFGAPFSFPRTLGFEIGLTHGNRQTPGWRPMQGLLGP
jgi:hypothetical protein